MTEAEQRLSDDKMRAEIAKLVAETSRINNDNMMRADNLMRAEIAKLVAETSKINNENRWYLAIVASTATLAVVAVVKIFL